MKGRRNKIAENRRMNRRIKTAILKILQMLKQLQYIQEQGVSKVTSKSTTLREATEKAWIKGPKASVAV